MSLCIDCNKSFKSTKCLQAQLKVSLLSFECDVCRQSYSCRQSLHVHKKTCLSINEKLEQLRNEMMEERKLFAIERDKHKKECDQLKGLIDLLRNYKNTLMNKIQIFHKHLELEEL
jgi:hypothetical protein